MFNSLLGLAIGALVLAQPPRENMSTLDLPPPPGMATSAPAAPVPAAPAPAQSPGAPPVMREIGEPPAPAAPPRGADLRVVDAEPVEGRRTQPPPEPTPEPAAKPKAAPQSQNTGGRRVAAFWFILPNP